MHLRQLVLCLYPFMVSLIFYESFPIKHIANSYSESLTVMVFMVPSEVWICMLSLHLTVCFMPFFFIPPSPLLLSVPSSFLPPFFPSLLPFSLTPLLFFSIFLSSSSLFLLTSLLLLLHGLF